MSPQTVVQLGFRLVAIFVFLPFILAMGSSMLSTNKLIKLLASKYPDDYKKLGSPAMIKASIDRRPETSLMLNIVRNKFDTHNDPEIIVLAAKAKRTWLIGMVFWLLALACMVAFVVYSVKNGL